MAFGISRPSSKQKHPGSAGQNRHGNKEAKPGDWEDWARRDTEATEEMYEKDLQQALLDSKVAAEQAKESKKEMEAEMKAAGLSTNGTKDGKKKKKKDKPQAMSLDQFNQLPAEKIPGSDDEEEEESSPPPVHTRVPASSQDTKYFKAVADDATKILQKERIQQQYQKAYAQESAMKSKYKDELEKKDKEITELKALLEDQAADLKEVKKRSTTLCKLLQHGEMKDKASILVQVEELTTVKDELTEQVATLTADLEKERSKVHALKLENDKLKGKHGK
eukprot:GHVL01036577.1.p1 GENE.GHVL01036577.1~~GHVL01036577.1.p1  ORF type:complete len:278 (+),score=60.66 GHVL01036577.1:1673-2506(+)